MTHATIDQDEMLVLLKQARTALKTSRHDVALERIRAAIRMIEPDPPRQPLPGFPSRAT